VAGMAEMKNGFKTVAGKPEGKRPYCRNKNRQEDNNKTYLK
jgi:hypothetical protein